MSIPQTPSPLANILAAKTYNAAWFSGSTKEAQINNAIAAAFADSAIRVFIPDNLSGYNAGLIVNPNGILLVSEAQVFGAVAASLAFRSASVGNTLVYSTGSIANGVTSGALFEIDQPDSLRATDFMFIAVSDPSKFCKCTIISGGLGASPGYLVDIVSVGLTPSILNTTVSGTLLTYVYIQNNTGITTNIVMQHFQKYGPSPVSTTL